MDAEAGLTDRKLIDITHITVTAELGNRISQAVRNAIELPNPRAREHYRMKPTEYEWGGDFHGRWLEAACLWSALYPERRVSIDHSISMLLDALTPDGSIRRKGRANDDFHVMISNWKALCGFLAAYELTGDEVLLGAARKMGLRYHQKYMDASQYPRMPLFSTQLPAVLECLVKLYTITTDERYLDLAKALAAFTLKTSQRVIKGSTVHTHTWLSALRGVVDIYGITQDRGPAGGC